MTEVRVVIAVLLTIGILVIAYMLMTNQVPEHNKDVTYTFLGGLSVAYQNVLGFYFGASKAYADQIRKGK
jgi:hypothetical protein